MSILRAIAYVFAVLVLFQFASVRLVLALSDDQLRPGASELIAAAQEKKLAPDGQVTTGTAMGIPVQIKIPKIQVNGVVTSVGLTAAGSMDVPKLPRDAGWYALGTKPGELGSAVIAGHVNWWNGTKGIFERIKTLKPGDLITVLNDKGENVSFVVRTTRTYDWRANASEIFFSSDGKSHLNLVTCSGIWNRVLKVYSKRLVVFADKVEE